MRRSTRSLVVATAAVAIAGGLVAPTAGAAATPRTAPPNVPGTAVASSWQPQASPVPGHAGAPVGSGQITSLSCPTTTTCVGVGGTGISPTSTYASVDVLTSGKERSLEVRLPANADTQLDFGVRAVSCSSATSCVAVGEYTTSRGSTEGLLLIEARAHWRAVEAPLPPDARVVSQDAALTAVSCTAAGSCAAVGTYAATTSPTTALALTDRAGAWRAASLGGLDPGESSNALAVSCVSHSCVAVGTYAGSGSVTAGFVADEGTGRWAERRAPAPQGAIGDEDVSGIACPSSVVCDAVGTFETSLGASRVLFLLDNHGRWSPRVGPVIGQQGPYASVSCVAAGACVAVGRTLADGTPSRPWLLTEKGWAWTARLAPSVAGITDEGLTEVACDRAGCTSIGWANVPSGSESIAVDRVGTRWSLRVVAPPPGSAAGTLTLLSTACPGPAGPCTLAGSVASDGLVYGERDGAWRAIARVVTSVDPGAEVHTVACGAAQQCAATETYVGADGIQRSALLAQVGGRWRAYSPPLPPGAPAGSTAIVTDVDCVGSRHCVAVGSVGVPDSSASANLVETWNGVAWTAGTVGLPSDARTPLDGGLSSIVCTSQTSCEACGSYWIAGNLSRAFFASLTSGHWTTVEAPVPAGYTSRVDDFACGSPTLCAAVVATDGELYFMTGDGTSWSDGDVEVPVGVTGLAAAPFGIPMACSPLTCVAVANYYPSGSLATSALVFDESDNVWSGADVPLPSDANEQFSSLDDVTCTSGGTCVAVGSYQTTATPTRSLLVTDRDGTWSARAGVVPSGASGTDGMLGPLACATSGTCVAFGTYNESNVEDVELETITPGSTSAVSAPVPDATFDAEVQSQGISCSPSGYCVAVGSYVEDHLVTSGLLDTVQLP